VPPEVPVEIGSGGSGDGHCGSCVDGGSDRVGRGERRDGNPGGLETNGLARARVVAVDMPHGLIRRVRAGDTSHGPDREGRD
jgi:hypothetical protein